MLLLNILFSDDDQWHAAVMVKCILFFYRRTLHLDNVKIPFYQQVHLLLDIKNIKIYIKISYIRSYVFRPTRTILRELTLSLAKLHFCRDNRSKYIVISNAVLWQHVFEIVLCVLGAVQRGTQSHAAQHPVHTTQPQTHAATTLHYL